MKAPAIFCPYCRNDHAQKRFGRTRSGSQRYRCGSCRKTYTPHYKQHGHSDQVRQEAVMLCLEGLSQQQAAAVMGVSQQSVGHWLQQAVVAVYNLETDFLTGRVRPEWITNLLEVSELLIQHEQQRGRGKPSGSPCR